MAYPEIEKNAIDESNMSRLAYKAEERIKERSSVAYNKDYRKSYTLCIDSGELKDFLGEVVTEAYNHGAASHDKSIAFS